MCMRVFVQAWTNFTNRTKYYTYSYQLQLCMFVDKYLCMYMCMCVCVYTWTNFSYRTKYYTYSYQLWLGMFVYKYLCMYMCVCMCVCVSTRGQTLATGQNITHIVTSCGQVYLYINIYVCICVCVCVCLCRHIIWIYIYIILYFLIYIFVLFKLSLDTFYLHQDLLPEKLTREIASECKVGLLWSRM